MNNDSRKLVISVKSYRSTVDKLNTKLEEKETRSLCVEGALARPCKEASMPYVEAISKSFANTYNEVCSSVIGSSPAFTRPFPLPAEIALDVAHCLRAEGMEVNLVKAEGSYQNTGSIEVRINGAAIKERFHNRLTGHFGLAVKEIDCKEHFGESSVKVQLVEIKKQRTKLSNFLSKRKKPAIEKNQPPAINIRYIEKDGLVSDVSFFVTSRSELDCVIKFIESDKRLEIVDLVIQKSGPIS